MSISSGEVQVAALHWQGTQPDLHLLRLGAECAERPGEGDAQDRFLRRGLAIEGGEPRARAALLYTSASRLITTGDPQAAERTLREAAETFERLGDVRSHAVTLGRVADILQARGQPYEALRIHLEERLPVAQAMQDVDSIAHIKFSCARIRLQRGGLEHGEAQTIKDELAESFQIAEQLGRSDFVGVIGATYGQLLAMAGHTAQALAVLDTAAHGFATLDQAEQLAQIRALQERIRTGPER